MRGLILLFLAMSSAMAQEATYAVEKPAEIDCTETLIVHIAKYGVATQCTVKVVDGVETIVVDSLSRAAVRPVLLSIVGVVFTYDLGLLSDSQKLYRINYHEQGQSPESAFISNYDVSRCFSKSEVLKHDLDQCITSKLQVLQ